MGPIVFLFTMKIFKLKKVQQMYQRSMPIWFPFNFSWWYFTWFFTYIQWITSDSQLFTWKCSFTTCWNYSTF